MHPWGILLVASLPSVLSQKPLDASLRDSKKKNLRDRFRVHKHDSHSFSHADGAGHHASSDTHVPVWDRPADWELTDPVIIEGEAVPRVSALLLIDSQDGFRESYNEAIPNMAKILGLFRQKCFPVVFKLWMLGGEATAQGRQIGPRRFVNENEYHELRCAPKLPLEELAPRTREEANRTMLTYHYSSFHQNPRLLSLLKEWKVNTVVLVGGYAEHCIASTAYAAFEHEFDVVVVTDAVAPTRQPFTPLAIKTIGASVSKLVNTSSLVKAWEGNEKGDVCPHTPNPGDETAALNKDPHWEHLAQPLRTKCAPESGERRYWPQWGPDEALKFVAG